MALTQKMLDKIEALAGNEGFWDDDNRDTIISIADYLKDEKGMSEPDILNMLVDLWNAVADEVSC